MRRFEDIPHIDHEEFDFVSFNLFKMNYGYEVVINLLSEGVQNGIIIRTAITADSIQEIVVKLNVLLSTGIFDHLGIIAEGHCFSPEGEMIFEFDYTDYGDFCADVELPVTHKH